MSGRIKIAILVGAWVALSVSSARAADQVKAGEIALLKGQVFILDSTAKVVADPEGKRGRKTSVGCTFFVGETVQTKPDARVQLLFIEGGNKITLGADTSLLIERSSGDPNKKGTTLNLSRGDVRSDVRTKYSGDKGETFEIKTKNAVAGVRGTIFTARFNPASFKSEFATERGAVFVSNLTAGAKSPGVVVKPGMFTVTTENSVTLPAPIASNPELSSAMAKLKGGPEGGGGSGNGGGASEEGGDKGSSSGTSDGAKSDKGGAAQGDSKGSGDGSTSKSDSKASTGSADKSSGGDSGSSSSGSAAKSDGSSGSSSASGAKTDGSSSSGSSSSSSSSGSSGGTTKNDSSPAPLGREPVVDNSSSSGSSTNRSPASLGAAVAAPPPVIMGGGPTSSGSSTLARPASPFNGTIGPPIADIINGAAKASNQKAEQTKVDVPTSGHVHVIIQ